MDKVQLQSCVETFKKRLQVLYRDSLSKDLEEKYVKIYQNVLEAQSRAPEELQPLFKRTHLIGHVFKPTYSKGDTRFVFNKDEPVFGKTTCCEPLDVRLEENILPFGKRIPEYIQMLDSAFDHLYKLAEITVYSAGKPFKNDINAPSLTIRDILSQVPAEYASRLICFEVLNEESSYLDKFNVVMNMYCFNVVLYGVITD